MCVFVLLSVCACRYLYQCCWSSSDNAGVGSCGCLREKVPVWCVHGLKTHHSDPCWPAEASEASQYSVWGDITFNCAYQNMCVPFSFRLLNFSTSLRNHRRSKIWGRFFSRKQQVQLQMKERPFLLHVNRTLHSDVHVAGASDNFLDNYSNYFVWSSSAPELLVFLWPLVHMYFTMGLKLWSTAKIQT